MESDRKRIVTLPVADADEDPNVAGGYTSPPCFLHEVDRFRQDGGVSQSRVQVAATPAVAKTGRS
jgi:hypothetical protein